MIIENYVTYNYLSYDGSILKYYDISDNTKKEVPTDGHTVGDYLLDASNGDWYIFNGSEWELNFSYCVSDISAKIMNIEFEQDGLLFGGLSYQKYDVGYATSGNNILNIASCEILNVGYATSGNTILNKSSYALDNDYNGIIRKKILYI